MKRHNIGQYEPVRHQHTPSARKMVFRLPFSVGAPLNTFRGVNVQVFWPSIRTEVVFFFWNDCLRGRVGRRIGRLWAHSSFYTMFVCYKFKWIIFEWNMKSVIAKCHRRKRDATRSKRTKQQQQQWHFTIAEIKPTEKCILEKKPPTKRTQHFSNRLCLYGIYVLRLWTTRHTKNVSQNRALLSLVCVMSNFGVQEMCWAIYHQIVLCAMATIHSIASQSQVTFFLVFENWCAMLSQCHRAQLTFILLLLRPKLPQKYIYCMNIFFLFVFSFR